MRNIFLIISIFIFFFNINQTHSKILIKYKIGDKIITNKDIINERNYLIFLRPGLKELSNEEIMKISINSLIREMIKIKEIERVFKNIDEDMITSGVKNKLFNFKNVNNEEEFLNLLNGTNIDYKDIIKKMKYEALWNELIFQKYGSLIKINKKKMKLDLEAKILNNKKYEYNISEILFEVEKNEKYEIKYKKILDYIKYNNFNSAATRFSIASSANNGGDIGWIKETLLSKELNTVLNSIKQNQITRPIKYPSGYLILRINDKKEMKQSIDIKKALDEAINYERNKQLSQFSILLYKKLKQNTKINEY